MRARVCVCIIYMYMPIFNLKSKLYLYVCNNIFEKILYTRCHEFSLFFLFLSCNSKNDNNTLSTSVRKANDCHAGVRSLEGSETYIIYQTT